jgi:hypothetical protein
VGVVAVVVRVDEGPHRLRGHARDGLDELPARRSVKQVSTAVTAAPADDEAGVVEPLLPSSCT